MKLPLNPSRAYRRLSINQDVARSNGVVVVHNSFFVVQVASWFTGNGVITRWWTCKADCISVKLVSLAQGNPIEEDNTKLSAIRDI